MNVVSEWLQAGLPDALALCGNKSDLTYSQLRSLVDKVAGMLLLDGCQKQDRVGIWAENGAFFVAAYLGVIRAGLVAVPFQIESRRETLAGMLGDTGIDALLVSRRLLPKVRSWFMGSRIKVISEADLLECNDVSSVDFPKIDPERDLACLMFTSGSTGKAKGVMVTHRNLACNTDDIVEYMNLDNSDRAMAVLPFQYCFGLSILHTHLAVGGSVTISNQFMYPEKVLQEMQERECTGFAGVPSTYQILLRRSRFKEMNFPSLRWLQQAGGKLPNPFIREIIEAFPRVQFYVMYGQTEATARLSYLPPERLSHKLGSIGKGLPSTRLEVVLPNGVPVRPGSGEIGEIVASGDNIALGYWNDSGETAKYFRDGKLYTGDLARVDEDGFIYVVDREREMIKSGGYRISAKEIEDVISEVPEVVEVAVVGFPDEVLGEAMAAFVVATANGQDRSSMILDHCRKRLPAFKVPSRIAHVERLPHGENGKVLKVKLKKEIQKLKTEIGKAE